MQDSVDVGDEIITAGGLHGVVREIGDDTLKIEIAPDVVAILDRRAVAAVAREVEVEVEPEAEVEVDPNEAPEPPRATRLTCPARVVAPIPPDPGCR